MWRESWNRLSETPQTLTNRELLIDYASIHPDRFGEVVLDSPWFDYATIHMNLISESQPPSNIQGDQ
jgi:hypothetical protein